jgi:hypothetical protein
VRIAGTARLSQREEDCWTSQSTKSTEWPCRCNQTARWTEIVDFPVPPLLFTAPTSMGPV